jgi:hypothetical protein
MKRLFVNALLFTSAAMAADDPLIGSYRLNVEKSRSAGVPLPAAATLVLSDDGDNLVLTVSGKSPDGSSVDEATAMPKGGGALRRVDGGILRYDSVTATRPTPTTIEMVLVQAGKEAMRLTYQLDTEHQVLTRTAAGTNARGQQVDAVFVFERQ